MRASLYARFSSDMQRAASIDDQFRNCRKRADAEGWTVVSTFADQAMSGSNNNRPQYLALLRAAARNEFDILMVDDLSRLTRDSVEQERTIRKLEFSGIRIIATSDGYDSQSKSRKIQRGIKGLMNDVFIDDLRDKVHRGLEGQAIKGYWTGGHLPFGYKPIRETDATQRDAYGDPLVIGARLARDPEQDTVVTEIFRMYADGHPPGRIAAELNERGVPAPRAHGWRLSGIREMLANPLYRGELTWNQTSWPRDPETGKHRAVPRPRSEWITTIQPELQIVSNELWQRVEERRKRTGWTCGKRKDRPGAGPKYLFSSLLKCAWCGGNLAIVGGVGHLQRYGCMTHKSSGPAACKNALYQRRTIVEERLITPIRKDLLTDDVITEIERRFKSVMAKQPAPKSNEKRIAELRAQIENFADAIATGALRGSKAIGERLAAAEAELSRLLAQKSARRTNVADFPIAAQARRLIRDLDAALKQDVPRARTALQRIVGTGIKVEPDTSRNILVAHVGLDVQPLIRSAVGSEIIDAAGSRSDTRI